MEEREEEEEYWAEDRVTQTDERGPVTHSINAGKGAHGDSARKPENAPSLASPSRPQILQKGSEEMTALAPAEVLAFVRFAKHIGCVSLPRDDTFVFVLAFSEYPRIVFYLQHICKRRYEFDVTACIQRCADIRV